MGQGKFCMGLEWEAVGHFGAGDRTDDDYSKTGSIQAPARPHLALAFIKILEPLLSLLYLQEAGVAWHGWLVANLPLRP